MGEKFATLIPSMSEKNMHTSVSSSSLLLWGLSMEDCGYDSSCKRPEYFLQERSQWCCFEFYVRCEYFAVLHSLLNMFTRNWKGNFSQSAFTYDLNCCVSSNDTSFSSFLFFSYCFGMFALICFQWNYHKHKYTIHHTKILSRKMSYFEQWMRAMLL